MNNEKFERIYKELVQKDEKIIEEFRKNANKQGKLVNKMLFASAIICLIIFIIYIIYKSPTTEISVSFVLSKFVIYLLIYGVIASFILMIPKSNSEYKIYRNKYKDIVIKDFIKLFNNNLDYDKDKCISKDIYKESEFEGLHYSSSDLIQDNVKNISISRIIIENLDVDKPDEFIGLFSRIELPITYNSNLYLRRDKKDKKVFDKVATTMFVDGIKINKLNKIRIKLNSKEFEEKFDLYGTNREETIKFMDEDMIKKLISFYNKFNTAYEFTIKNNCIYIRLFGGYNIFEPPQWSSIYSLDKENLYETYKILDNIFSLIDVLVNKVNEVSF